MNDSVRDLCEELGRTFQDLAPLLAEHISDNDGLLPHVFMGDVTRYIVSNGPQRVPLVKYLDERLSKSSGDEQELIAVSFVENLESLDQLELTLQGTECQEIRNEWRRQHST